MPTASVLGPMTSKARCKVSQFTETFDRQQAFSAGFALAAKDWNLTDDEYQAFCKTAAEMLNAPAPAVSAPAAPPAPTPAPAPTAPAAPVVPITDAKQADQVKVDNFVAQKAQAIQGQPQQKAAADVAKKPPVPAAAPKPAAPAPPAPPAYNAGPQTPPGVSAFSPQANQQARNAALRKSLNKKDYVRRMALEQVADLEIDTGLAPPTAAAVQQQEAAKRQQAQAAPKPAAQPAPAPAPAAAPATGNRGALAPALAKFMKNPSL